MKIVLKSFARETSATAWTVTLTERLPGFVEAPLELSGTLSVRAVEGYYLLNLRGEGVLSITCQRCMEVTARNWPFDICLAVAANDDAAERLMEQFEVIVAESGELNLQDLLTDELHLSAPRFHENEADCRAVLDTLSNVTVAKHLD
ncbi:metal-binding protein [Legionella geestiana]|uniref:Metal-binding protein n=1 Tax=Legionella geestiana TaxID=45065 RepID=A0A0W0TPJ0_9GAMM|nr:YceD family protein [Legionella geestiana]KTC97478.1 metal-binding protein [Legionella geestiana]QBS13316.1 DUF177 domain-containing protein [Legionella geestiana]QDQ40912.1 DUF177 domain-containing protein [Legionella geestiana]STX54155.1 metal-binding, possibly nucleic acid-binding protein [Legionella geestiana]